MRGFVLLLLGLTQAHGATHPAAATARTGRSGGRITTHKRLHVNDVIAEPGTVEFDFAGLYSNTTATFALPSALKWTPDGATLLWGRTEYSAAFDSVSSAIVQDERVTQFSDRITVAATSVVYDSAHFDVAVAPAITALLRGDSGVRAGVGIIARCDAAGNTAGIYATWSGASAASPTNPSGVWDVDLGYGRRLDGRLHRFTPHVNILFERATGSAGSIALFGGVEYQVNVRFAVAADWQRYGLNGGAADRQIILGFTYNLGRLQ